MLGGIEANEDALGRVIKALVAQAVALDDMFYRAAKEAYSVDDAQSYYHARKALAAQAKCRATFMALVALRRAACRAEAQFCAKAGAAREISNLPEGTIQKLKTTCPLNALEKPRSAPAAPSPGRRARPCPRRSRRSWSPERRARQALMIRTWQPWRKSTGPRTQDGKARSSGNALKHGLRSKASVEARREDRRVLSLSAHNIATVTAILRSSVPGVARLFRRSPTGEGGRAERGRFHSIGIGRATPALIPSRPRITGESLPGGTPLPMARASPRRGWRIAS